MSCNRERGVRRLGEESLATTSTCPIALTANFHHPNIHGYNDHLLVFNFGRTSALTLTNVTANPPELLSTLSIFPPPHTLKPFFPSAGKCCLISRIWKPSFPCFQSPMDVDSLRALGG